MKWIMVAVLVLGAFAVAGLSAIASQRPPGTAGGTIAVEIVMTEMRFSPNRVDARVGQPVVITLINRDSQRHDLAFPSIEMPGLRGIETLTLPGESSRLTLTFDRAGIFPFLCTIPGHAAAGMAGAVFVSP